MLLSFILLKPESRVILPSTLRVKYILNQITQASLCQHPSPETYLGVVIDGLLLFSVVIEMKVTVALVEDLTNAVVRL